MKAVNWSAVKLQRFHGTLLTRGDSESGTHMQEQITHSTLSTAQESCMNAGLCVCVCGYGVNMLQAYLAAKLIMAFRNFASKWLASASWLEGLYTWLGARPPPPLHSVLHSLITCCNCRFVTPRSAPGWTIKGLAFLQIPRWDSGSKAAATAAPADANTVPAFDKPATRSKIPN